MSYEYTNVLKAIYKSLYDEDINKRRGWLSLKQAHVTAPDDVILRVELTHDDKQMAVIAMILWRWQDVELLLRGLSPLAVISCRMASSYCLLTISVAWIIVKSLIKSYRYNTVDVGVRYYYLMNNVIASHDV